MKVRLVNDANIAKEVKVGFSWTTFFFGLFVPLIRGDLKWAAIMFAIEAIVGAFTLGFGAGIIGIVFAFIYNKIYIKELLEKGYRPASEEDREKLVSNDIVAA